MARKKKDKGKKPSVTSQPSHGPNLSSIFYPVLIILSVIAGAFINFPHGDSWTHGWVVKEWLHGNFVFNDWSTAIALPQQILGWIVHIGADEVQWWRLSILTAIVTTSACYIAAQLPYRLFPQFPELKKWIPAFTLVMLAPTFTLKVGAGFFTDGYYLLLLASALWVLAKIINDRDSMNPGQWTMWWGIFTILATLSVLQRTHGLVLLILVGLWALVIYGLTGNRKDESRPAWTGWIPVIFCAAGVIVTALIMKNPALHPARAAEIGTEVQRFWQGDSIYADHEMTTMEIITDRLWLIFSIVQYMGLAILPLAIGWKLAGLTKKTDKKEQEVKVVNWPVVIVGGIIVFFTFLRWMNGEKWELTELYPYYGNSLTPEGFGAKKVALALTKLHTMSDGFRFLLTVLSTTGSCILVSLLFSSLKLRKIDWKNPAILLALIALAHIAAIFLNETFIDRYLLPLMPFMLLGFIPVILKAPKTVRINTVIVAVILLIWSIAGTAGSLKWSESKWEMVSLAGEQGIPSDQLIAGYEPDGFLHFSNVTYPGLEYQPHPAWWVSRLGLQITPAYVVMEEGVSVENTPWMNYRSTTITNGIMRIWAYAPPDQ